MKKEISFRELTNRLGNFIKVENAPSRNGRDKAVNQFILRYENGSIFQSYDAICGVKIGAEYFFTDYHDYSNTTTGHVGRWCGYKTKERRDGLENGKFTAITNYYRD